MASFTDLMKLARRYSKDERAQTTQRFKEILSIVRKHDLRGGITPQMAVELVQELGTTFIKLGQIASTHPDVLPAQYCDALGKLRTNVSPMDFDTVRAQVEAELGKPLAELFSEFDERAVGSASIAQVHRAVLPDGSVVAVKVQRPGIVETVSNDLAIMERLVDIYDLVTHDSDKISLKELVAELVRTSTEELDFANEAANLERFWRNNNERPGVTSPRCHRELCTSAVLVEDFASSPCAENIDDMDLTDAQRDKLAYLVANNYMQQVMVDGFYHADPHAGNILITADDGIEWIDFGMMGTMTSGQRETLCELVTAVVKGDAYGLKRYALRIATPTGPIDHSALLEMCEGVADQFIDVDLESFDTAAVISSLTDGLKQTGFDIDPFLVSLGRGLVTLEGTIRLISPRLNIMQVLSNYLVNSFDPKHLTSRMRRLAGKGVEGAEAMAELPSRAADSLDMLQKGQVKVGIELSGNERFIREVHSAASLVALSSIAMATIIGSCILGASEVGPRVLGVPVLGAFGLACGIALAIYVVVKGRPYSK